MSKKLVTLSGLPLCRQIKEKKTEPFHISIEIENNLPHECVCRVVDFYNQTKTQKLPNIFQH